MSIRSKALCALALIALHTTGLAQPAPPPPNAGGAWGPLESWPLIGIHAVLTPGGNVLTFGSDANGKQTGRFIYDVWNPAAGSPGNGHTTLPNGTGTDIFCSAQLVLPQGEVFIAGGDNFVDGETTQSGNSDANLFVPSANTLARAGSMHRPRWYASVTTLPSGETYIQGGTGGADHPEVRASDGSFRLLALDTQALDEIYPRNFVAPDGRLFGIDIDGNMYFISSDLGALTHAGTVAVTGGGASAAMYAPGKILLIGGNSDGALTIDINGAQPQVSATTNLATRRDLVNATMLADGRVLATGGSAQWNKAVGINNSAALWDPATGQWSIGPDGAVARLYHSMALLLPDATVLVGGGGAPGPFNNNNAEIYYPPYLFDALGAHALRPQITSAPASIDPAASFSINVGASDVIARVTLIKTGSVTHSWNMDQRFTELAFTQSGTTLTLSAPADSKLMPPGYYLLFALNDAGVPSVAKIVKANLTPPPPPQVPNPPTGGTSGGPTAPPVDNPTPEPPAPTPNPVPASGAGSGGGCALNTGAAFDLSLLWLLAIAFAWRERSRASKHSSIDRV